MTSNTRRTSGSWLTTTSLAPWSRSRRAARSSAWQARVSTKVVAARSTTEAVVLGLGELGEALLELGNRVHVQVAPDSEDGRGVLSARLQLQREGHHGLILLTPRGET
jgi:hypothetical protein